MAHDLLHGQMAYVGEVPWHGLGKAVAETVTARDMCRAAGLDWTVRKVPAPGSRIIGDKKKGLHERYLVFRDALRNEPEPVCLGLVRWGYEVLQNTDAFAFFEPFITGKFATFHTAGALGNGERVWVMAKLTDSLIISENDVVDRFLLLANSHDGSSAVTIRFTPVRVVCQNTLNFAMQQSSGVISVRHSRNVARNLADAQARQLKEIIDKAFADARTLFGKMALKTMNAEDTEKFLKLLFPLTDKQKKEGKEPERWARVKSILDDSRITPQATRNTLWSLYNAVVRDEDYREARGGTPEARLQRIWFGAGHDLKLKALEVARNALKAA
jgi:phage/plasmid-like protein (TIGR03299 family)